MKKATRLLLLFLILASTFASFGRDATGSHMQSQAEIPMTGIPVPGMASFDRIIPDLMTKWQIPGGAVAVIKDSRLVLAHGYGYADKKANQLVQPDSLFRIASLSKQITSAAVLKLVEEGKLGLDAKAFTFIDLQPPQGAAIDARIYDITIRQLLQHSGGWDRYKTFDPASMSRQAAQAVSAPTPATAETIIRYMLGQPLQFTPGTEYQYSNFGYCVLGRIIEKVSGQSYEDYVKTHVLNPAGGTCMRLGRTLLAGRAEREVRYYDFPGAGLAQSVFPDATFPVPWPYGGFYIEARDSHGGWIASTVDLMRFLTAVDGRSTRPDILQPATISLMVSRPGPPLWVGSSYHYGMGWSVRPINADANWWHSGSLPGTSAFMVRSYHGLAWVALFNSRPADQDGFFSELDNALWQAVNGVTDWPNHDLFNQFTECTTGNPAARASIDSEIFNGKKNLTIEGSKFGDTPRVLINDTDRTDRVTSASDTVIKLKSKEKKLGLKSGDNTVQVVDASGAASNVYTLRL